MSCAQNATSVRILVDLMAKHSGTLSSYERVCEPRRSAADQDYAILGVAHPSIKILPRQWRVIRRGALNSRTASQKKALTASFTRYAVRKDQLVGLNQFWQQKIPKQRLYLRLRYGRELSLTFLTHRFRRDQFLAMTNFLLALSRSVRNSSTKRGG
jgi:hypothetical protein